MIGFTAEHRATYRIRREQGGSRIDPYAFIIPGSRGHLYVHGPDSFGVATKGKRRKLRTMPWLTITQDGDDGFNGTFPAERLKTVARMIGAYRRWRLSPERRAKALETLARINLNRANNASDGKNVSNLDPDHLTHS